MSAMSKRRMKESECMWYMSEWFDCNSRASRSNSWVLWVSEGWKIGSRASRSNTTLEHHVRSIFCKWFDSFSVSFFLFFLFVSSLSRFLLFFLFLFRYCSHRGQYHFPSGKVKRGGFKHPMWYSRLQYSSLSHKSIELWYSSERHIQQPLILHSFFVGSLWPKNIRLKYEYRMFTSQSMDDVASSTALAKLCCNCVVCVWYTSWRRFVCETETPYALCQPHSLWSFLLRSVCVLWSHEATFTSWLIVLVPMRHVSRTNESPFARTEEEYQQTLFLGFGSRLRCTFGKIVHNLWITKKHGPPRKSILHSPHDVAVPNDDDDDE